MKTNAIILLVILSLVQKIRSTSSDTTYPGDCSQIPDTEEFCDGIKTIYINNDPTRPVAVECEMDEEGCGWTVIQMRRNIAVRENFYRSWIEYVVGFGSPGEEYWIGLEDMHILTSNGQMELKVDLEDYEGEQRYAKFESFYVGSSSTNYQLSVYDYSGTAGDSLSYHNQMQFSTYDNDNDLSNDNCAQLFNGAFWYKTCHEANLNGYPYEGQHESYADGIEWTAWRGQYYSYRIAKMRIRPASLA